MCGRYACKIQPLGRWSSVFRVWIEELNDRYNIAPTSMIPVFTVDGWQWMRWGLIPSWSKEPSTKYSTFNARAESLTSKPAYRTAWKHGQRCLVPATGYYEWKKVGASKQPYFIRSQLDEPLVYAGLWDLWESGRERLLSCSVVTVEAQGALQDLHDRMPLLLEPDPGEVWLHGGNQECAAIMENPPAVDVVFYPVDKAVGNVRNQGEQLMEPVSVLSGERVNQQT